MNKPARIIPRSSHAHQTDWQRELAQAIRDPAELLRLLELPEHLPGIDHNPEFPLRVPRSFINRMQAGDPADPLLRQVLSLADERQITPGYVADPLEEQQYMPVPGLLHKYPHRVLLTVTGACAVHCRYCFRRHFPYQEANPARDGGNQALDYVRHRQDIQEIILSGGDPLALADQRLFQLLDAIEQIPHVTRLRWHTRLPVVIPARVTPALLNRLEQLRLANVMVLHINHPREIDSELTQVVTGLRETGATLLNQAVLLRGVNDTPETLAKLSETLFDSGILPYYLHQLDPVAGTAHFALEDERAQHLIEELRGLLPGYLVPRLVREVPGQHSKSPL